MTPDAASKTYGAADPALTGTLTGFLAADGVTATYSRTAGETVGGRAVHDQRESEPAARAGQLHDHLQHGRLHDQRATASVTPNAGEQDLRRPRIRRSRAR